MSRWDPRFFRAQLESGEIDVAIGVGPGSAGNIQEEVLYEESFTCMVRKKHPYLRSGRTLKDYVRYPHVLVITGAGGRGFVDELLEKKKLQRDVLYRVGNFSSAPYIVEAGNVILTAPRRVLEFASQRHAVVLVEPPFSIPSFSMKMFWHTKNRTDPRRTWLKEQVRLSAAETAPR